VPPARYRKVLILGYRAVGKTSVAHQFLEGKFVECYVKPTVESTYKAVVVGKDELQLQLVGTAGQDKYAILPHSFTIGIHSYVLVYSVTSLQKIDAVPPREGASDPSCACSMPVVLVGNKADLALQSWELRTGEGKRLAESWGAILLESSAKESQVTMGIFMKLIEEINQVDNSYGRSTSCCLL
ncbi:REBL1 GTPase, partial [Paradoxornis webbianus]|nr:REBL1 GTPase [Sinosuthora webbiana]